MRFLLLSFLFLSLTAYPQVNIQSLSESSLLRMLKAQKAVSGLVIVKEIATGKEIALAGYTAEKRKNGQQDYLTDTLLFDALIEPGALIMPISAAILMDHFGVTLADTVDLEGGSTVIDGFKVFDSERYSEQNVSLNSVISLSSNVGIAKLTSKYLEFDSNLYLNSLKKYIGTNKSIPPEFKSKSNLAFASFGYGLMLSPSQILKFYERVGKNDSALFNNANTLIQTKKALLKVTKEGTAQGLMIDSEVDMGIKTATTLALDKNGYKSKQYFASIVGYAPFDNPKYACIVIIKCRPNASQYYGATVAGPVFKEIMNQLSK